MLAVVAALVLAVPALAQQRYRDATGENRATADITSVIVSNDATTGDVEFSVYLANVGNLEHEVVFGGVSFDVFVDADRNPATGDPHGFDAKLSEGGWDGGVTRWDGKRWNPVYGSTAAGFSADNVAVSVAQQDLQLRRPKQPFDFAVVSHRMTSNNDLIDVAPNYGVFTYRLTGVPSAHVISTTVAVTLAPAAGHLFQVGQFTVGLSDDTTAPIRDQRCTASIAGKPVRGTGAGHCTWLLPKTSRGKQLAVNVSGHYAGHRYTKRLTYRIT